MRFGAIENLGWETGPSAPENKRLAVPKFQSCTVGHKAVCPVQVSGCVHFSHFLLTVCAMTKWQFCLDQYHGCHPDLLAQFGLR